jgi:hypothetical protein
VEGPEALGATPSESIVAASTNIKLASGLAMNEELFTNTFKVLSPSVGISAINNSHTDVATGNALVEGVSQVAQPIASPLSLVIIGMSPQDRSVILAQTKGEI